MTLRNDVMRLTKDMNAIGEPGRCACYPNRSKDTVIALVDGDEPVPDEILCCRCGLPMDGCVQRVIEHVVELPPERLEAERAALERAKARNTSA